MNAKELRIGNLTDKGIVQNFYENGIHVGFGKCFGFSEIKPIPLTEDRFDNLNPKHISSRMYVQYYDLQGLGITVVGRGLPDVSFLVHGTKIKYLHQLQNLYFALKDEELTFKI